MDLNPPQQSIRLKSLGASDLIFILLHVSRSYVEAVALVMPNMCLEKEVPE